MSRNTRERMQLVLLATRTRSLAIAHRRSARTRGPYASISARCQVIRSSVHYIPAVTRALTAQAPGTERTVQPATGARIRLDRADGPRSQVRVRVGCLQSSVRDEHRSQEPRPLPAALRRRHRNGGCRQFDGADPRPGARLGLSGPRVLPCGSRRRGR